MTTKEKLIHTTGKLIREKGVAATGIAEIIELSEIPKGSIYHHFPNGKDELVIAALQNFRDLMAISFKESMKGSTSVTKGLKAIIDHYILSLENSKYKNGCPVAIVALECSGHNETITQACKQVMDFWIENLTAYFKYKKSNAGKHEAIEFISRLEGALIMTQIYNDSKYLLQLKKQINTIINE